MLVDVCQGFKNASALFNILAILSHKFVFLSFLKIPYHKNSNPCQWKSFSNNQAKYFYAGDVTKKALSSLKLPEAATTFYRSNRFQMFCKLGFLKNFAKFTGKHLCWSFFL